MVVILVEDYLLYKQQLDEVSQRKLEIYEEEQKCINNIKDFGRKYLTTKKRLEIIEIAKTEEESEWIFNDLISIHDKWSKHEISHQDIIKFLTYDTNVKEYEATAYKRTWLKDFHSFFVKEVGK